MRYNRNESFRYQLTDFIDATFTVKVDEATLSRKGHAFINNISPNGLRFRTEYDLPADDTRLLLQLQFHLNRREIVMPGHISWKKKSEINMNMALKAQETRKLSSRLSGD
ncbi:PilZ domain-containing protein [Niallia circulans]